MLGTSNVKIEAVVVKLMLSNRKPTGSKNQKLLLRSFSTEITSNHMGNSHLFILSSDNFTVKYFTVDQSTPIMSFFYLSTTLTNGTKVYIIFKKCGVTVN